MNCKVDDVLEFVPEQNSADGCGWKKKIYSYDIFKSGT